MLSSGRRCLRFFISRAYLFAYDPIREKASNERKTLSRSDLIDLEGTVSKILGRGNLEIECNSNMIVRAVLSGKMKKNRIRVIKGDRVKVSVSPYDTSHGIITYRFK